MKRSASIITAFFVIFGAVSAYAVEGGSLERGKELFESATLGKNGKSCASCHPGGRKLEWAATYDEAKLTETTNRCIVKALQGKALPADSDDLKSLAMYLKTFAGPGN